MAKSYSYIFRVVLLAIRVSLNFEVDSNIFSNLKLFFTPLDRLGDGLSGSLRCAKSAEIFLLEA